MDRLIRSLAIFKLLLFFFIVIMKICFWFFTVHDHFLITFSVHHHLLFIVWFSLLFLWVNVTSFVFFFGFLLLGFRFFLVDELLWLLSSGISSSILLLKTYPIKEIFFELNQFMFDSILFLLFINGCFGIFTWFSRLLMRLIL